MAKKKRKTGGPSEARRRDDALGLSPDELKSRIVRAVDEAISRSANPIRMNGGSYTRSDSGGTYTRPDRTLTRG